MQPGFQSDYFRAVTGDGRNFTLEADAIYVSKAGVTYVLPIGATTDGASTPEFLWPTLPPFGSYWRAAVLHDCAYRNTLLTEDADGHRSLANLSKAECDSLLLEAMELSGTHEITREEIYQGVVIGGANSFDQDRVRAAS